MGSPSRRWDDVRPKHGIILMHDSTLLCNCGTQIELTGKDANFSQRIRYDLLLDIFANHKRKETP